MDHDRNLLILSQIKKLIEGAMINEIDLDYEMPEQVINLLAWLHSELKDFL